MHELTGKIAGVSVAYATGKLLVTFEFSERNSASEMVEELKGLDKLTLKVKKFSQKRSLDANAYCWTLIGKLAEKLNIPRTDIYRSAIKEIGGNSDTVCIQTKAVESLCEGWQRNGIGWLTDTMPSKIDGCTNVILYYGSSTYDVPQMSRLINLIVQECRMQGIETRSEEELRSLMDNWGNHYG